MSLETAKAVVEFEFANAIGFDEVEFDLFGGEPTLCKELIIELVEWTICQKFSKPFVFFLQTNGTLIHGDFQNWLVRHKQFVKVGLSLDGSRETHNFNRSKSYDRIDISFFLEHYKTQGVRMTINAATIENLKNDIIHLHALGFERVDAFFAYGIDWDDSQVLSTLCTQLRELADYYLDNPKIPQCSLFDMSILRVLHPSTRSEKWCGTGTEMVSVAVDGKRYPCQAFQPNTNENPISLDEIDFNKIKDFSDNECSDCPIEAICPNCYGINYLKTGDMLKRDKSICNVTKLRAMSVSYLRGQELIRDRSTLSPAQLFQTIKAIQKLQTLKI